MNVLFVCKGNICRSPLAAAFLRKKYKEKNIDGVVMSAGFSPETINDPPDPRAIAAAKKYDIDLSGSSRIFVKKDFDKYDKIYVMDTLNFHEVKYLARTKDDKSKIDYAMNILYPGTNQTVPDPIYSGIVKMDTVLDILDKITDKISEEVN